MEIIIRLVLYFLLMYATTIVVPGVVYDTIWPTLVIATLVLYIINLFVKPIIKVITLPINFLTLGLFSIVINAVTFWLVGYIVNGFDVTTISAAELGGLFTAFGAWVLSAIFDKD